MIRAMASLLAAALGVLVLGTPLLLVHLVRPAPRFAAWVQRVWSRIILTAAGTRLTIEAAPQPPCDEPAFYVGNHQSALDIPILFSALRGRIRFLAKDSLFRIPLFGPLLARVGHVSIDRTNPRAARSALDGMMANLRTHPLSMVVFPEGTRSPDGRLLPFRKGAMKICQRAGLAVVPFAIQGSAALHRRAQVRIRPGRVRVTFGQRIPADEVAAMTAAEFQDRVTAFVAKALSPSPAAAGGDAEEGPQT